jgi:yeast amino acid transporter
MITISGVLGVGLYVRGGLILRLGGPLAVLLSFAFLGALAWAVMQCIAEMVCIWPISGAISVYVKEFVDEELGIAVGVAYWFTYSISFACLIAATASEIAIWDTPKGIQAGIIFFVVPLFLLILNAFGIEWYGLWELVGGTLKLSFLLVIIIVMIAINAGAGNGASLGTSLYPKFAITVYDHDAANSWATAFFQSLGIAAFAFVGVEIVAASALEARVARPRSPPSPNDPTSSSATSSAVGRTVLTTAVWLPFLAGLLYVIAGFLVTLNIPWDSDLLPRQSWLPASALTPSDSAFIVVARQSGIPGLEGTLNVFLVFTALTCANTNLYVASRTLFSLTRSLDGGPNESLGIRFLASLGRTNARKVPMKALVFSCIFAWVPFLYLAPSDGPQTAIGKIIDVLSNLGSVGVIIVWTCECWAFIRFLGCVDGRSEGHKSALRHVTMVRRWNYGGKSDLEDDYPYRSHGQPFTAWLALGGCLFILVVANGAGLWKEFHFQPFLSGYLAVICFAGLVVGLKVVRRGQWRLVDLSNGDDVAEKMKRLHEIRFRSAEQVAEDQKRSQWLRWIP